MIRRIIAVIAGIVVAGVVVAIVEEIGHIVYPLPETLDWADPTTVQNYMATLPLPAILFVLAAWVFGAFGGSVVATLIAKHKSYIYSAIVTGMMLLGSIYNLLKIPHPTWFAVLVIILVPLAGYLAWLVVKGNNESPAAPSSA